MTDLRRDAKLPSLLLSFRVTTASRQSLRELIAHEVERLGPLTTTHPLEPNGAPADATIRPDGTVLVDTADLDALRIFGARWPEEGEPFDERADRAARNLWEQWLSDAPPLRGFAALSAAARGPALESAWFVHAVRMRLRTLQRVLEALVARAPRSFTDAAGPRATIDVLALSEAVPINDSALAPIVANTRVECVRGVVGLDSLVQLELPSPD
jgi:hypothetical protein